MPSSFSVWDANTVVSRVHVSMCCLCEGCVFFGEPTQGWPQRLCRTCWKGLVPSLRDCSECAPPQPCPQENAPRTSTLKALEGLIAKLLSHGHAACTLGPPVPRTGHMWSDLGLCARLPPACPLDCSGRLALPMLFLCLPLEKACFICRPLKAFPAPHPSSLPRFFICKSFLWIKMLSL